MDPKHLGLFVCLEELALITTKRDRKTSVLVRVRVKEALSNTGVRASDDSWWIEG